MLISNNSVILTCKNMYQNTTQNPHERHAAEADLENPKQNNEDAGIT